MQHAVREFDSRKEEEGISLLNSLAQSYGKLLEAGEADLGEMQVCKTLRIMSCPTCRSVGACIYVYVCMVTLSVCVCVHRAVLGGGLEDSPLHLGVHERARIRAVQSGKKNRCSNGRATRLGSGPFRFSFPVSGRCDGNGVSLLVPFHSLRNLLTCLYVFVGGYLCDPWPAVEGYSIEGKDLPTLLECIGSLKRLYQYNLSQYTPRAEEWLRSEKLILEIVPDDERFSLKVFSALSHFFSTTLFTQLEVTVISCHALGPHAVCVMWCPD